MSPQTLAKIPVVDFSKQGTSSYLSIRNEVCHALKEFSCFVALLPNEVDMELHNTYFGTLNDLFNFPAETKMQSGYEKPFPGGYITANAANEGMGIGYATDPEDTRRFTNHFWPNGNDAFRESADMFAKVMEEVDHVVTRMVFENYGVGGEYLDDHIKSTIHNYRFNKYNEPEKTGVDLGLPAHTDKTFTTILYQNHVKGLEIRSKQDEWLGFDPLPASFLILAGDGLEVWSNGRIRACLHRVNLTENATRFSFGVFSYRKGETEVAEELVDDDHPLQYKPLHQIEYIQYYKKNYATLGPEYSIKTHCGV